MKQKYSFLLLVLPFLFVNVTLRAQENATTELNRIALKLLKPNFSYRYNLYSNHVLQNISERKTPLLNAINPADTLLLKAGLKNDTTDAHRCFLLFGIYKTLNKTKQARFYSNKSIFWYEKKFADYPLDSATAMNLAVLYTENNYFEEAAEAYKALYHCTKDKEMPSMMLAMIYMTLPDSMNYFIDRYDKATKEDYKKMLLLTTLKSIQFMYSYTPKDSLLFQKKNYKEMVAWDRIEKIYKKNNSNPAYELMYNSLRTYLIIMQCSIVNAQLYKKYTTELSELEQYYFKVISSAKMPNKLIPYLSLASIYTFQKRHDQALIQQKNAIDFIKKYSVTSPSEAEDIINSYIGLFEVTKKYSLGKSFTEEMIKENNYSLFYRKAFIYFSYQEAKTDQVAIQLKEIAKNHSEDVYPQLINSYEAYKKGNYSLMYDELKIAYIKNPTVPEIYAMMTVLYIATEKYKEASMTLKNIEEQMPETALKLKKLIP